MGNSGAGLRVGSAAGEATAVLDGIEEAQAVGADELADSVVAILVVDVDDGLTVPNAGAILEVEAELLRARGEVIAAPEGAIGIVVRNGSGALSGREAWGVSLVGAGKGPVLEVLHKVVIVGPEVLFDDVGGVGGVEKAEVPPVRLCLRKEGDVELVLGDGGEEVCGAWRGSSPSCLGAS